VSIVAIDYDIGPWDRSEGHAADRSDVYAVEVEWEDGRPVAVRDKDGCRAPITGPREELGVLDMALALAVDPRRGDP